MTQANERRKNDRLSFCSALQIRRADSAERSGADACDLSVSGMSFRTQLPLVVGDELRIHINKVAEHASIAARVRHIATEGQGYLVGVEHVSIA